MNYLDCLCDAANRALEWSDLPEALLPLVIISEATLNSERESDAIRHWARH